MEIQTCEHDAASVIRLSGRMAGPDDCEALQQAVRDLVNAGRRAVVINLKNVDHLAAPGMSALAAALDTANKCGVRLKLACVGGTPAGMLASAKLDGLFDICSDEHEALLQLTETEATAHEPGLRPPWASTTVIEFPSAEGNVTEATRRFGAFLELLGIDITARFGLRVAFHEAFANAVKHGNKADPSKCVVAECSANGQMLKIRVTDEGDGFDAKAAIAMKSNPFHDSGHGLVLIRNLMDEVSYNAKGNSISMVKFCSQPVSEHQGGQDYGKVL